MKPPPPCRLMGIVAPDADVAVIFRRGPTDWTRMSLWNLHDDSLNHGQWLHAKVFARRSDVSRDGKLVAYFASDYGRPMETWTAISKPPYFTALALWPKGDSWGGGGLFMSPNTFWLNHREPTLHPDYHMPARLTVTNENGGGGEDYPIFSMRLRRDGWTWDESTDFRRDEHMVCRKPSPRGSAHLEMTCYATVDDSLRRGRGCYFEEYALIGNDERRFPLPDVQWADWDRHGRLLVAQAGTLCAMDRWSGAQEPNWRVIDDLNGQAPEPVAPSPDAKRWPK